MNLPQRLNRKHLTARGGITVTLSGITKKGNVGGGSVGKQGKSGISWAGATWSPIRGCTGCGSAGPHGERCWGARWAHRQNHLLPGYATANGWTGRVGLIESALEKPLRRPTPTCYAVGLMGDLFHKDLPDWARDRVFAVMQHAYSRGHRFICLTKQNERMTAYFQAVDLYERWLDAVDPIRRKWTGLPSIGLSNPTIRPLPHVILGVSAWDQASAEEACRWLRQTPAACRLLCLEPLLGAIPELDLDGIGWVIVAGETGPGARPMHPHWVRAIRDQCQAAGVPFWFKAWGSWVPSTYDGVYHNPLCDGPQFSPRAHGRDCHDFGDGYGAVRLKRAGRLLDGEEHNGFPEIPR